MPEVVDTTKFSVSKESWVLNRFAGASDMVLRLYAMEEEAQKKVKKDEDNMPFEQEHMQDITLFKKSILQIHDLLYEPFDIHTRVRRKTTVSMLSAFIRHLKLIFNKKFKYLVKMKIGAKDGIKEQEKTIKEVAKELDEEFNKREFAEHPMEDPKSM